MSTPFLGKNLLNYRELYLEYLSIFKSSPKLIFLHHISKVPSARTFSLKHLIFEAQVCKQKKKKNKAIVKIAL